MRRPFGWLVLALVLVLGLSGCQDARLGSSPSAAGTHSAAPSQTASPEAAVTFSPQSGSTKVRPDQQVVVTADSGKLTSVTVKSNAGTLLSGGLDALGAAWRSTGVLLPGTGYTVTAVAANADGASKTATSTFTTLKPDSTMRATIIPDDGWEVGVGMPVMVEFASTVKNKDAVLKTLTVTTTPQVEGAWHWMSGTSLWWRPKDYWPTGTKVQVTAAVDSAELTKGVWGRRTITSHFTVGSSVVSTVDVNAHTLTVTKDGKVVRVIPVTTGMPTARYRTRGGIKVIMDKRPVEVMDAETTGIPKTDPNYYSLKVQWAMRLTWSGEYLHAAPWSVYAQGHSNVSHGCTGMSMANAKWMYDFSKIGDVVVYKNSTRKLEPLNGYTAWELSWEQWAGSAAASSSGTSAGSTATSGSATTGSATTGATASPQATPTTVPTAASPSLANPLAA